MKSKRKVGELAETIEEFRFLEHSLRKIPGRPDHTPVTKRRNVKFN